MKSQVYTVKQQLQQLIDVTSESDDYETDVTTRLKFLAEQVSSYLPQPNKFSTQLLVILVHAQQHSQYTSTPGANKFSELRRLLRRHLASDLGARKYLGPSPNASLNRPLVCCRKNVDIFLTLFDALD